ncbi:MAG: hypothetical protein M3Y41_06530, partial [Pseudomonadota bacterium]|nr:hypothetical protein [Pseudomonadota bacterium]
MSRLAGQAGRGLWIALRGLLVGVVGVSVVAAAAVAVLAWVLAEHPVRVPWLAGRIAAAADAAISP